MAAIDTIHTTNSTLWSKLAGAGGVTFAVLVAASNVALPNTPAWDADGAEVARWVHDHHTVLGLTVATFALSAPAVVAFAVGFVTRVFRDGDDDARTPALIGAFGVALICALFSSVEIARLVSLALDGSTGSEAATGLVWHFEAASFVLNTVAIGIAAFGFGIAGARVGLLPRWFGGLGIAALLAGIATALPSSGVVNGQAGWQIGLISFVAWLLLVVIAGTRMIREA
jgi:Domain of unknown function (DUF4386)